MFQSPSQLWGMLGRARRSLRWLPGVLFAIFLPVFLVMGCLTWAFNNVGLYEAGFEKYRIARVSGITTQDLRQVALELRAYFNSTEEPLQVRTRVYGLERDLFNAKEVHHMADVKRLLWGVYFAFGLSAALLLGALAAGLAQKRPSLPTDLARWAFWGGLLTVVSLLLFGIVATVGFDALFLLFHQVSFANDFWRLDPRTDYLVLLFPQGFWFDATMWFALRALAGGAVLTTAGGGYMAWRRWRRGKHFNSLSGNEG